MTSTITGVSNAGQRPSGRRSSPAIQARGSSPSVVKNRAACSGEANGIGQRSNHRWMCWPRSGAGPSGAPPRYQPTRRRAQPARADTGRRGRCRQNRNSAVGCCRGEARARRPTAPTYRAMGDATPRMPSGPSDSQKGRFGPRPRPFHHRTPVERVENGASLITRGRWRFSRRWPLTSAAAAPSGASAGGAARR